MGRKVELNYDRESLRDDIVMRYEQEGSKPLAKEYNVSTDTVRQLAFIIGVGYKKRLHQRIREKIKKRYEKEGPEHIAKEHNLSIMTIERMASTLKIKSKTRAYRGSINRNRKRLQKKGIDYDKLISAIITRYPTEGPSLIAKEFGFCTNAIEKMANRRKIYKRGPQKKENRE